MTQSHFELCVLTWKAKNKVKLTFLLMSALNKVFCVVIYDRQITNKKISVI